MLTGIDLLAIAAVCVTTITCFVIRASRGADVDTLEEQLAETQESLEAANERADKAEKAIGELQVFQVGCSKVLRRLDKTGEAIAKAFGGGG